MYYSPNTTEIPLSLLNDLQDLNYDICVELQHFGSKLAATRPEELKLRDPGAPREIQHWENAYLTEVLDKYDWDYYRLVGVLKDYAADTKGGMERWEGGKLARKVVTHATNVRLLLHMLPEEQSYMAFGLEPIEGKLNELAKKFLDNARRGDGGDEASSLFPKDKGDDLVVAAREMLKKWKKVVEESEKHRKERADWIKKERAKLERIERERVKRDDETFNRLKSLDRGITYELHTFGAPRTTSILERDAVENWCDVKLPRALASLIAEDEILRRVVAMPSRCPVGLIADAYISDLVNCKSLNNVAEDCINQGRKTLEKARELRTERERQLESLPSLYAATADGDSLGEECPAASPASPVSVENLERDSNKANDPKESGTTKKALRREKAKTRWNRGRRTKLARRAKIARKGVESGMTDKRRADRPTKDSMTKEWASGEGTQIPLPCHGVSGNVPSRSSGSASSRIEDVLMHSLRALDAAIKLELHDIDRQNLQGMGHKPTIQAPVFSRDTIESWSTDKLGPILFKLKELREEFQLESSYPFAPMTSGQIFENIMYRKSVVEEAEHLVSVGNMTLIVAKVERKKMMEVEKEGREGGKGEEETE